MRVLHMKFFKFNLPKIKRELILKIVVTCSLVFVLIALLLSVLLFNKGYELFKNNDQLASLINKSSAKLDQNSGTKTSIQIPVSELKKSYKNPQILQNYQKQIDNIMLQRNALGAAMENLSKKVPGAEGLTTAKFINLDSYENSIDNLLKSSVNYAKLQSLFADNVVILSEVLNVPLVDQKKLKTMPTPKEYEVAFKQLTDKASSINKELELNEDELSNLKSKFDKLGIELNKYENLDSDYKILLQKRKQQNVRLVQNTKSLNDQLDDYKNKLEELRIDKSTVQKKQAKIISQLDSNLLLYKLHGEVVKYDKKWGSVIINLGRNNIVPISADHRSETVKIPILQGAELIVARNGVFVARIKINQVFDNYSLASISFPSDKILKVGDIVFYSENQPFFARK
jgi:DNA repair exonuclease SbcCD ATPase subunit